MYDVAPNPQLELELGILAASLVDGTREWRENLGSPAQEAVIWQVYPNGPSIGGAILHMANCEYYWLGEFALNLESNPLDPATLYDLSMDQDAPFWPSPPHEPIEWYFEIHDRHRARSLELIATHNQPKTKHYKRDFSVSYRWILAHLVQHDSYTGGQTVLLHEIWKKSQSVDS